MSETNIVPPDTAAQWVNNWRTPRTQEQIKAKQSILGLKGFLIPQEDLSGIMGENAAKARCYFGIDENNKLHQLYVGVNANGDDMIGNGNSIYDLTKPCPPMCSSTGPLK